MRYLIRYRVSKRLEDNILTADTEEEVLSFARHLKTIGCEYVHIYKIKYDLELTLNI